jgi:hypothetical protein
MTESRPERTPYFLIGLTLLAFALFPVYLFESGGFQLIDIVIVAIAIRVLPDIKRSEWDFGLALVSPFIPFIAYTTLINAFYLLQYRSQPGYVLSTIQILYGFSILFIFSVVFRRIFNLPNGSKYIYLCLLVACITPWLIQPKTLMFRNALSFNNPNQLGYYALLITFMLICTSFFARRDEESRGLIRNSLTLVILGMANVFAIMSVSRAAIAGIALLDVYLLRNLCGRNARVVIVGAVAIVLASGAIPSIHSRGGGIQVQSLSNILERFTRNQSSLDDLRSRSVLQLDIAYNEALIFGRGGTVRSLENMRLSDLSKGEVHNVPLFLFYNYGLIGLSFFLGASAYFITRMIHFPHKWLIFLPLLIYNLTHYGLRFRCMWVAISLLAVVSFLSSSSVQVSAVSNQNYRRARQLPGREESLGAPG